MQIKPGAAQHHNRTCHIQELNANHALSPNTLAIQESDAFCAEAEGALLSRGEKKRTKTGL